jgi:hypothetical protein
MTSPAAVDARDLAQLRMLQARELTRAGNYVNLAVSAGATTKVVSFTKAEPNVSYGVRVTPGWGTTVWVTGKLVGQCTVNFGTAAPGGGSTIDVSVFRSEA